MPGADAGNLPHLRETKMAVSANRLELLQIADAVAREKAIDREEVLDAMAKNSILLGKTMGGNTTAATEVLTTAMNQFGIDARNPIEAAAEKGLIRGKLFIEASKARKLIVPEERKLITGADLGFNKLAAD